MKKMVCDYTELSKEISYALRHNPSKYGLKLDSQGWVSVTSLIMAIKSRGAYQDITINDIENMILLSDKKRHEIKGDKIRALYGHSIKDKIIKAPHIPPDILYHGTAHKFLTNIMLIGLMPKARQYVHLTHDKDTALECGRRRDSNPVVLKINSKIAWNDGVLFYQEHNNIWLADPISPKYISITQV